MNKMKENPLVSVCVPTYNYARFLPDCIESVLGQTFTDWELVICDDCSLDETSEVVHRYARKDSRIRYVKNSQRRGMNPNLKWAADLGRGRYLKILCSDDWMAPRCLEVMYKLMEKHESASVATCAEIHTDTSGAPLRVQYLFGEHLSIICGESMLDRIIRRGGFGGNSSLFLRASAYHSIGGYNPARYYAADFDLQARLCTVGHFLHTDEALFYGRRHPDSSSANDPKKLLDVKDWFKIGDAIFRPRRFGNRCWRRYHAWSGHLTARYLLNYLLEHYRGHHRYAAALWEILAARGDFAFGLPFLPFISLIRLYNRLIHKANTITAPVPTGPHRSFAGPISGKILP